MFLSVYNSVAAMKADTGLSENSVVQTTGYYTDRQGGGAEYTIVNDPALIADGGSVHDMDNGLKACIVPENGQVNALQFGARGCNYWSPFYDSTNNIQSAINYVSKYVQTDVSSTNFYCAELLINGNFFVKELTADPSQKFKIVGYDAWASTLEYVGDSGYVGNGVFNDDSYILKLSNVESTIGFPFFSIERVGFLGIPSFSDNPDNRMITSIANCGLFIDVYYDWGTQIRGCRFTCFVKSGIRFNQGALNGYMDNLRFDACGRSCISIQTTRSFKVKDFTIDSNLYSWGTFDSFAKSLFNNLPWIMEISEGIRRIGNTFIEFDEVAPAFALVIDCARIEGEDFVPYEDNPTSFIEIKDATQLYDVSSGGILLSNINWGLHQINSIVRVQFTPTYNAPRVVLQNVCREFSNVPIKLKTIWFPGEESVGSLFIDGFETLNHIFEINSAIINRVPVASSSSIAFNGKQFDVTDRALIENTSWYKYNDTLYLTQRQDGFSLLPYESPELICVRPLLGYGYNLPLAFFPASFVGTVKSTNTIATGERLKKNASYTVTLPDTTAVDICCTLSVFDNVENRWINTFNWHSWSSGFIGEDVNIIVTKCEWKRVPLAESGAVIFATGAIVTSANSSYCKNDKQVLMSGLLTFSTPNILVSIELPFAPEHGCTISSGSLTFFLTSNSTSATVESALTGDQGFQLFYKTA